LKKRPFEEARIKAASTDPLHSPGNPYSGVRLLE
jgi:hypothetical protein